jgi:membrane-bound metal-dependent hydrolase YbcI (DUF457 family)
VAGWHRPLGRKALAWGVALGTLPDLDIVVFPWLDTVQRLYWHRGASHSLFLILPTALAVGWLVRRVHRGTGLSFGRAAGVTWLIFFTHVLIDFFTVYGTQLLAPFSRHGFGSNNLFIIDPLYTLPLLAGCLLFALWPAGAGWRANRVGLLLSTLYVVWSFGAQAVAPAGLRARTDPAGHRGDRTGADHRHGDQHGALAPPRAGGRRFCDRLSFVARCGWGGAVRFRAAAGGAGRALGERRENLQCSIGFRRVTGWPNPGRTASVSRICASVKSGRARRHLRTSGDTCLRGAEGKRRRPAAAAPAAAGIRRPPCGLWCRLRRLRGDKSVW